MHRTLLPTCVFAAALLGCATDPTSDTTNADASGSSSASESGADESGESGATETGETGEPQACTVDSGCAEDEFCDFPDGLCGSGEPGACAPRPDGCGNNEVSECGCDGMAYIKDCATVMGVDTHTDAGTCTPPPNHFPCGPLLCDSGIFYCRRSVSDVVGIPDSYSCSPLPDCGGNPVDCTCLASENCGDMCEATGAGFTLTCPGG